MQIPWGELYLISDGEVLQAAWKDQNVVLFMSTVSDGIEKILRQRRRPPKTATNARTSRQIFGDLSTKELLIPRFIDDYNHYMGGVDQADQLKSYYTTQRKHSKNWKPLWHFLLDITVTNCFKLHQHYRCSPTSLTKKYTHKEFRTKLAIELFNHSERLISRPGWPAPAKPEALTHYIVPDSASEHRHTALSKKPKSCIVCKTQNRRPAEGTIKRKALGELSHNIQRANQASHKRKLEMKRTTWGCELCQQPICKQGSCWNDHIEAIQ